MLHEHGRSGPLCPSDTRDGRSEAITVESAEREIVAVLANGHTNRRIAEQLVISERTVDWPRGSHPRQTWVAKRVLWSMTDARFAAAFTGEY